MDINADVCKYYEKNNRANPFSTYLKGLSKENRKPVGCPAKVVSFLFFYPFFSIEMNRNHFRDTITFII